MAVPAHDQRDLEFADEFDLPIMPVVEAVDPTGIRSRSRPDRLSSATGRPINSGEYDGLPTAEFKAKITADLAAAGWAATAVNYRLRDWLFSRQHYWGEPFPIWHELDADGNPTGLIRAVAAERAAR